MADLEKLVDELSKLTVIEAAELATKLEDTWGVSAAAPVMMAAVGGDAGEAAEEKDSFDVILTNLLDLTLSRNFFALGESFRPRKVSTMFFLMSSHSVLR